MAAVPSEQVTIRAAIYCRISRDATGEGRGVERQRQACQDLAKMRGWQVEQADIYTENDMSATRGKRPLFQAMIDRAVAGDFQIIMAWAVDRLTRNMLELEQLIILAEKKGLTIVTATGDLDLSVDTGRQNARILAAVSRGEIERKSARQKAANRQRAEAGKPPTNQCFGYRIDGSVIPEEAHLVQEVFRRFIQGAPITRLVAYLDDSGQPAAGRRQRRGENWTRTGVRNLLLNRRYIAEVWYLREKLDVQAQWEPLVDRATFGAAAALLSAPARMTTTGPSRKWLGSGLFRCGLCAEQGIDRPLVGAWSTSSRRKADGTKAAKVRYYRCNAGQHAINRQAADIDSLVEDAIVDRLNNSPKGAVTVKGRYASVLTNVDHIRSLMDEVAALEGRKLEIAGQLFDQVIDNGMAKAMRLKADAQIRAKQAQIGKLSATDILAELAGQADPGAAWLALDIWRKAKAVELMCTVTVNPAWPGEQRHFNPSTIAFDWKRDVVAVAA